jgi:hypothetical protein
VGVKLKLQSYSDIIFSNKLYRTKIYICRYLRFAVILAVLLMFSISSLSGTGHYLKHRLIRNCEENWWTVLLMIQNYKHKEHYVS